MKKSESIILEAIKKHNGLVHVNILADITSYRRSTVKRAVNHLLEMGEIEITQYVVDGIKYSFYESK